MKFFILSMLLVSSFASADTKVIATGLPADTDYTVDSFINYKSKANQAWIQVHVGEWFTDHYSWDKPLVVAVEGLYYDGSRQEVLYSAENGEVISCGKRNIFSAHHLELSGRCKLNNTIENNTVSVVFTAN